MDGIFENQTNINLTEDEPVSINDWNFLEKMQAIYKNYTINYPRYEQLLLPNSNVFLISSFFIYDFEKELL